jgi:hypothetical protein
MSDWSRHTRYSTRKPPHDKRPKPLYGEREDRGVWYRCWVCGFQIDSSRTPLGGANQPNNIPVIPISEEIQNELRIDDDPSYATILTTSKDTPLITDDSGYATILTTSKDIPLIKYYTYVSKGTGCPFCFTLNWR